MLLMIITQLLLHSSRLLVLVRSTLTWCGMSSTMASCGATAPAPAHSQSLAARCVSTSATLSPSSQPSESSGEVTTPWATCDHPSFPSVFRHFFPERLIPLRVGGGVALVCERADQCQRAAGEGDTHLGRQQLERIPRLYWYAAKWPLCALLLSFHSLFRLFPSHGPTLQNFTCAFPKPLTLASSCCPVDPPPEPPHCSYPGDLGLSATQSTGLLLKCLP